MELLEGKSLHAMFLEQAPIDWRRMFEIARKLCAPLAGVHVRGVGLGTLRAETIYLVKRPGEPEVVELLDHRIAEVTTDVERDPQAPRITAVEPTMGEREMRWRQHRGLVVHSVDYHAPEQLMGKPLDARTDIYAIGVLLYEMLTGARPFPDETSPAGLITAILKQVPKPPSAARRSAGIPPAVDEVVLRCLNKDPNHRYPDALELELALRDVLADASRPSDEGARRTLRGMIAPPAPELSLPFAPPSESTGAVEMVDQILEARGCDSEGCSSLHRVLPGPLNETVGGWMFLDHVGPVAMAPGQGMDELVHPHVGLVSVRYLFEGQLIHRDSLGTEQALGPGGVNWMSAGRGVVHTEHSSPVERRRGARLHGLQLWLALPSAYEDDPPAFVHHGADALPTLVIGGVRVRVVLGEAFGARSPVVTPALLSLIDIRLPAGTTVPIEAPRNRATARAVYVVSGAVEIGGTIIEARRLAVVAPHGTVVISASRGEPAHIVVLGSPPLVEPCYWWWSFVATSLEGIEAAKRRWAADELGSIPGVTDRLPMPTR